MLKVSNKMIFCENEAAYACAYCAETCKGVCGYDVVYNFFI